MQVASYSDGRLEVIDDQGQVVLECRSKPMKAKWYTESEEVKVKAHEAIREYLYQMGV